MKKSHLTLNAGDEEILRSLLKKGTVQARKVLRINALLLLSSGLSYGEVANQLGCCYPSVSAWASRYRQSGLSSLEEQPRSGRPPAFSGEELAKVTALACSSAPEGHAQWSLRLLSDRLVELGIVEEISHTTVGRILKKRTSAPS